MLTGEFVGRVEPPTRTLGASLRARRENLGLSQAEVARRLGTSQQTYQRWESDGGLPRDREHFRRIAEFLDTSVVDVLTIAFVPEPGASDYEYERSIRDVEERIAEARQDENDEDSSVAPEILGPVTIARVRHIEAMLEEVAGANGSVMQLQRMVAEVRDAHGRLEDIQREIQSLRESRQQGLKTLADEVYELRRNQEECLRVHQEELEALRRDLNQTSNQEDEADSSR